MRTRPTREQEGEKLTRKITMAMAGGKFRLHMRSSRVSDLSSVRRLVVVGSGVSYALADGLFTQSVRGMLHILPETYEKLISLTSQGPVHNRSGSLNTT